MPRTGIDAELQQIRERAWLIMALISSALSDHPAIRSNRLYRRLTDRSRRALFDLHSNVEAVLFGQVAGRDRETAKHKRPKAEAREDDFGSEFLRLKGSVDRSVRLGIDSDVQPGRGKRARKRRGRK